MADKSKNCKHDLEFRTFDVERVASEVSQFLIRECKKCGHQEGKYKNPRFPPYSDLKSPEKV